MLWYKAWLETRARFLICLLAMAALCISFRSDLHRDDERTDFFYYAAIHNVYGLINALWLVAAVFLTMGGLLRERAAGAASFTLSLPFTRERLMKTRITLGLAQAMTLIVVPCIAIWVESRMYGVAYPISQAWFHFVLMVSGGLVVFAIALLVASMVEGEYTAPLVAFCAAVGLGLAFQNPPVQGLSPFRFMGGGDYFDRSIELFVGPIPWLRAAVWLLVAAILLAASVKAIQRQEF